MDVQINHGLAICENMNIDQNLAKIGVNPVKNSDFPPKNYKLEPQGALIAHLSTMSTSVIS